MVDANDSWNIYVADTYGGSEPQLVGLGWAPAWGPTGQLAYTGCDATGCGIIIDNPDDGQPGVRLTASSDDGAVSWAKDPQVTIWNTDAAQSYLDARILDQMFDRLEWSVK